MKYIAFILLLSAAYMAQACELISEPTETLIENSKGVYIGYVTSLRIRDYEEVLEDQFPPIGLQDRQVKISVVQTLMGKKMETKLISAELSWCGGPDVQVGEKVIAFAKKKGKWTIKKIGVNPDDIPKEP